MVLKSGFVCQGKDQGCQTYGQQAKTGTLGCLLIHFESKKNAKTKYTSFIMNTFYYTCTYNFAGKHVRFVI